MTTEKDTTEKATTEKTEEATTEADTETADYSKEVIKMGGKTIKVNDPDGYERSYASQYGISLDSSDGSIYARYESNEGSAVSDVTDFYKGYFSEYEEKDDDKIESMTDGTVKAKDGTEVSYILVKRTVFDSNIDEFIFMYPLGDDTIVCDIKCWDAAADIDAQSLCSQFIDAMEIK